MDLRSWLRKPGNTKNGLAKAARTTWRVVNKIAEHGHVPKVSTAQRIERATGGEVTAAEILGVSPRKAKQQHAAEAS